MPTLCPACWEEYRRPKLLPCTHTVCLQCIESRKQGYYFRCPVCFLCHRLPPNGGQAYVDNEAVAQLIAERKDMSAVIKYFSETYLQEKGARDTSLLTFCKDNLSGLKRSYDPNECSHCKTREGELRRCAKCHVAKYCSKECQSVDWKARHKRHCREITMLEETICRESEADMKIEKKVIADGLVFKAGETHVLRSDMCHKKMCVLDHKTLILKSYFKPRNGDILTFYDCTKGLEDRPVVMDKGAALILGQEAVSVGGSMYVAVTLGYPPPPKSGKRWQINFYPHDSNTLEPCYTYKPEAPTGGVGALHFTDGKLLVATDPFPVVEEFDVSMFPIKPTGKVIRANDTWLGIDALRTLVQDREKRIVTVQTLVFGKLVFLCLGGYFFQKTQGILPDILKPVYT